ncbi:MAG: hypothetical protein ABFS19_10305 [Thermodesulfobacteriota bacterium]
MALINIDSVLRDVIRDIRAIEPPGGIELLSYKRNRTIALIRQQGNGLLLRENGYRKRELQLTLDDFSKPLKKMIKHEFPRSRKVRVMKFSDPEELDRIHQKI